MAKTPKALVYKINSTKSKATNIAPSFSKNTYSGTLTESITSSALSEKGTTGKLKATDQNSNDTLTFSANKLNGKYGALALNSKTGKYEYSANESKIDALGNKTVYDTFKVYVTDGKATDTANLKFKIVGKNDAPVVDEITGGTVYYDIYTDSSTESNLTGTITADDVDV